MNRPCLPLSAPKSALTGLRPTTSRSTRVVPNALFGRGGTEKAIVVKDGDTLWGISVRENVPLDDLIKANDGSDFIRPRQVLKVKVKGGTSAMQEASAADTKLKEQAKQTVKQLRNTRDQDLTTAKGERGAEGAKVVGMVPPSSGISEARVEAAREGAASTGILAAKTITVAVAAYGVWRVFRGTFEALGVGVVKRLKGESTFGLGDVYNSLRARPGKDSEDPSTAAQAAPTNGAPTSTAPVPPAPPVPRAPVNGHGTAPAMMPVAPPMTHIPCFRYPDGGVGFFIADVSGPYGDEDPRLVCFEDEFEARRLADLLRKWRPAEEVTPLVQPGPPEVLEELSKARRCEVLVVKPGEVSLSGFVSEEEVQARLASVVRKR
ncbi:unnamed protein product [Pedinophyceae sp. YPF-701]|nr:unnamed protein product [Pedinophyceae sp. YPF-701]